MKTKFMTAIAVALAMSATAMAQEANSAWPWDFPQSVPLTAETGQNVLSCYGHYFDAVGRYSTTPPWNRWAKTSRCWQAGRRK